MKKLIIIFLLTICIPFSVWGWGIMGMSGGPGVDWDLLDEDCFDISDWSDNDTDTAVSEVSPAGQFRMDTNTGAAGNAKAWRKRALTDCPNTFTIKCRMYLDAIGTYANYDDACLQYYQTDESIVISFGSDGLKINDTDTGLAEVGTDLTKHGGSAEMQTWWFLVTFGTIGDGVCDVYLDDSTHNREKVNVDPIPCSREGAGTNGLITIRQFGYTTNDRLSHVDYVKVATGLYIP